MTIPIWPDGINCRPLFEGFSLGMADGRLVTEMDSGPPKIRRKTSAAIRPSSGAIALTRDQAARLTVFWEEDTAFGSLPFLIRDHHFDGIEMADEEGDVQTEENGNVLVIASWWLAVFSQPPVLSRISPSRMRAELAISILP